MPRAQTNITQHVKSDSEAELRRGSTANPQEQPSEPHGDHKGKLDSPSHFLIALANQVMARAPPASTITDEFHELPANAKEELLKRLVEEIMESLHKGLPGEEKEEFLNVCFTALYAKVPWRSQLSVANMIIELLSPPGTPGSFEAPKLQPMPGMALAKPSLPRPRPWPELFSINIPDTIGQGKGRGRGEKG